MSALELFPTQTERLCQRDGIGVLTPDSRIALTRQNLMLHTPYTLWDWAEEPLTPDRVIYCLVGEVGTIMAEENTLPDGMTPIRFLRRLAGFLPNLEEYLSAAEEDLGLGDILVTKTLIDSEMDTKSIEFELFALPSSLLF